MCSSHELHEMEALWFIKLVIGFRLHLVIGLCTGSFQANTVLVRIGQLTIYTQMELNFCYVRHDFSSHKALVSN
jgi:hypothetical protein